MNVLNMGEFKDFFAKACTGTKPLWAFAWAWINYILFPDDAYLTAFCAVGVAMILDIATKYYAYIRKHGSYSTAVKVGAISSAALWEGTKIKLMSYLIVFILTGVSYRVTVFSQASIFAGSVVYSVIFLREAQSVVENLCEAGAKLQWLVFLAKKKQEDILDFDPDDAEAEKGDEKK